MTIYFPNDEVNITIKDGAEYEVYLKSGCKIEFKESGEWTHIDANDKPLPASVPSLLPSNINVVKMQYFPDEYIHEIKKDFNILFSDEYEISLSNDVEIHFKVDGTFLKIEN